MKPTLSLPVVCALAKLALKAVNAKVAPAQRARELMVGSIDVSL
jgi:hypothetical protein